MKSKILFLATFFLFFFNLHVFSQQWDTFTMDCCPGEVEDFSIDTLNHRLYTTGWFSYLVGGVNNDNVGFYSTLTNDWHYLGSSPEYWDANSYAILYHNDTVYNGGAFHSITNHSNHIAMFADTSWQKLNDGFAQPTNGSLPAIYSLAFYNNQLYAAGNLTGLLPSFDSIFCIAKWDGTNWSGLPSFGFGSGVYLVPDSENYIVQAMVEYNGELFVGGVFNQAGGIAVNGVAKWNGNSWSYGGNNTFVEPSCFVVYNNELYMGGAGGLVKYQNSNWTLIANPAWNNLPTGWVLSLAVYNNTLVVGGIFDSIGGIAAKNIARWDGQNWSAFGTGVDIPGFSGEVKALAVLDGCLYVGGSFSTAGGLSVQSIARWCEPLSTQHISFSQSINIYPNPTTNFILITGLQNKKVQLKIFDIVGKEIIANEITAQQNKINLAALQKGIYLFLIADENGNLKTGKFVKQ